MEADPQELELLVREIMDKVSREQHRFGIASGTVVDVGTSSSFRGSWAMVDLDEDDAGDSKQIPVAVGTSLRTGDRVLVAFDPPHGGYVIGVIEGISIPCRVGSFRTNIIEPGGTTNAWIELVEYDNGDENAILTVDCGYDLADRNGDGILDAIIIPEDGIYMVSATMKFGPSTMSTEDIGTLTLYLDNGVAIAEFMAADTFVAPASATSTAGYVQIGSFARYFSAGDMVWPAITVVQDLSLANWHGSMTGSVTVQQICCEFVPEDLDEPTCA